MMRVILYRVEASPLLAEPACVLDIGYGAMREAGDLKVIVGRGSVDASGGRVGHIVQLMRIMCRYYQPAIHSDYG